jgi:hypothetical protein
MYTRWSRSTISRKLRSDQYHHKIIGLPAKAQSANRDKLLRDSKRASSCLKARRSSKYSAFADKENVRSCCANKVDSERMPIVDASRCDLFKVSVGKMTVYPVPHCQAIVGKNAASPADLMT